MIRVVLDTNIIVSAFLTPAGQEAVVLLLALQGMFVLCLSPSMIAEYEEVLRRPRFKLRPREIETSLAAMRKIGYLVEPHKILSVSAHETDNRFLECAEAAEADYLITGNARHFPQSYKTTTVVNARQFLALLAKLAQPLDSEAGPFRDL